MIKLLLITLLFSAQAPAKPAGDKCHVYVADQSDEAAEAMEKAMLEISDEKELEKFAAQYVKILGEFTTDMGEEHSTTRSFELPARNGFVTVTVYYRDESMAAEGVGSDSMLLSLAVGKEKLASAQGAPECSQAEISIGRFTGKVRVKKVTQLNGKEHLIGLECECNTTPKTRH